MSQTIQVDRSKAINLSKYSEQILAALILLIFLFLVIRNIGVPSICPTDDILYRPYTGLLPVAESVRPNYLYFLVYSLVQLNSDHYFLVAKILNALLFVSAAPFIYQIALLYCSKNASLVLAIASLLGTIDVYTLTFMPEIFYFLMFWIFTWYFITRLPRGGNRRVLGAGVLFGMLSLIKPHALLLTPSFIILLFILKKYRTGKWLYSGFISNLIFWGTAISVKLSFGFIMAGINGVTLIGNDYSKRAQSDAVNFYDVLGQALVNLPGHLQLLSVLYGFPIAVIIAASIKIILTKSWKDSKSFFVFYALLLGVNLILMTSIFSGLASFLGPGELITRIHARYYNFIFPAFMILGASRVVNDERTLFHILIRSCSVLFPLVFVIIAVVKKMEIYIPSPIDCPEFYALQYTETLQFFAVLTGGILIFWACARKVSSRIYLWVFIPLFTLAMTVTFSKTCSDWIANKKKEPMRRAVTIAKAALPENEFGKLWVVSPIELHGYALSAILEFDLPQDRLIYQPANTDFDASSVPAKWILFCGQYEHIGTYDWTLELPGQFSLARKADKKISLFNWSNETIDLLQVQSPLLNIKTISGLSHYESWGAWSNDRCVRFEFFEPLPEKFLLHITASAFGPNIEKPVVIKSGSTQRSALFKGEPTTSIVEFDNPSAASVLEFVVPEPVTPKSLGVNEDERLLGIGFINLEVYADNSE